MHTLVSNMSLMRLASGLPGVLGKTVAGTFLAEYARGRFRVILTFTDGTHYEVYGEGTVNGSRAVESGGTERVREALMDDAAVRVVEITPEMLARRTGR